MTTYRCNDLIQTFNMCIIEPKNIVAQFLIEIAGTILQKERNN